jgi:hypothetical protein
MPERVRELITSRLEHLSTRARELAAVAAVIGREFEFPTAAPKRVAWNEAWTAEGVEELVRRRVLQGIGDRFRVRPSSDSDRRLLSKSCRIAAMLPPPEAPGRPLEELSPEDLERDPLPMGPSLPRGGGVGKKQCFQHVGRAGHSSGGGARPIGQAVVCFEGGSGGAPASSGRPGKTLAQAVDLHLEARGGH